jgi:hypothetical protein
MRISKDSKILGTRSSELVMIPTTSRPNSGCLFVAMDLLYVRILLMKFFVSKYRLYGRLVENSWYSSVINSGGKFCFGLR